MYHKLGTIPVAPTQLRSKLALPTNWPKSLIPWFYNITKKITTIKVQIRRMVTKVMREAGHRIRDTWAITTKTFQIERPLNLRPPRNRAKGRVNIGGGLLSWSTYSLKTGPGAHSRQFYTNTKMMASSKTILCSKYLQTKSHTITLSFHRMPTILRVVSRRRRWRISNWCLTISRKRVRFLMSLCCSLAREIKMTSYWTYSTPCQSTKDLDSL